MVFALIAALAVVAALLPFALIFSRSGPADDKNPPPAAEPEVTDKFEAEYANLDGAMNPQLDGENSFVERSELASNGMHIAYYGAKGNTVTFEIDSSAADENATLFISLVSIWNDVAHTHVETDFDAVWNLYVNDEPVKVNMTFLSPDVSMFHSFVEVFVNVSLKESRNVIKLICPKTGDGSYGLNTDYIRFETSATLSWFPYKENKIRPSD